MKLKQVDTFLFKVIYLVMFGIIVTQVLNLDSLTSLLFLTTFPLTVLLWLRSVRKTVTETDVIMILTAAMAVVGVLLNAGAANADLSFQYLKKLIMFVMTLLYFQTAYRVRIHGELADFINKLVDLLTLFLLVMYLARPTAMHTIGGRVSMYLTFRFTNPNMTAMFLVSVYMLKMHRLFTREKWYVKFWHCAMLAVLLWFVVETQSRNALLVLVMYTVLSLWLFFRGRKQMYISKGWAALFSLFPAFLVGAYMTLVNSRWIQKLLSFLISEGKQLDSRVKIWKPALENLWQSPLFGAYYEISHGTGESQMHNSHMDIAASYGIVVLLLVCVLLIRYLHQDGRRYADKSRFIYILGFAGMVVLGMGEAAVFSGGLGIYILAGTFLLLANQETDGDGGQTGS